MPEVNNISFTLDDILVLLIKHANLHEGNWTLGVGWQIGAGNYGPTPSQTFPGVAAMLSGLGLQKLPDGPLPTIAGSVAANAAKVNPAPSKSKKQK
jgi:hypothetical protein